MNKHKINLPFRVVHGKSTVIPGFAFVVYINRRRNVIAVLTRKLILIYLRFYSTELMKIESFGMLRLVDS